MQSVVQGGTEATIKGLIEAVVQDVVGAMEQARQRLWYRVG